MAAKVPVEALSVSNVRKRALLDTNVWRYVVDDEAAGRFLRIVNDSAYIVQIAPSVVYEAFRLQDASLRKTLLQLMTNHRFQRLMPEAYSESMEILREIERVRPDWLRENPDLRFFDRLKKDWSKKTGGFWVRCARSPEREAGYIARLEGAETEAAREQARIARKEMMDIGWSNNPPMDKTLAGFDRPTPGWRGDMVEAWRLDALACMTYALARQGNAYRDWMSPYIEFDYGLLDSADWREFWLYLSDKRTLPKQWLRWAHSFAQRFRRVSSGAPGDTQLSTYFTEADLFVTADKALIDIMDECRPYAPCPMPEGKLIPSGAKGVASLFHLLEN